jgi:hypothetical protein
LRNLELAETSAVAVQRQKSLCNSIDTSASWRDVGVEVWKGTIADIGIVEAMAQETITL